MLYLCIKVYFDLWSMLVLIKRVVSKRFEWCWKKEKKLCKKVVQKGACVDCGRGFCMSCLMSFLIVCLVIFAVSWLVSNDWDCLMSLWKKSHIVFIIWKHYFGFLLDALFGLTWRMLTHVRLIQSRHKPLWSFSFWLLMPSYASFNAALSLCMIMAVIALLVGRSQSFASPHFVLSRSSTRASNS
jgi:hypothetical protein